MQYTILVTIPNVFTVEAETKKEAIQKVKSQLQPRDANAASYVLCDEAVWDEEEECYVSIAHKFNEEIEENECSGKTDNISDERTD